MLMHLKEYIEFSEAIIINGYTIEAMSLMASKRVYAYTAEQGAVEFKDIAPGYKFDFYRAIFIDPNTEIIITEHTNSSVAVYAGCKENELSGIYDEHVEDSFHGYFYNNDEGVRCHTWDYEESIGE
jgi:hypothetical protein